MLTRRRAERAATQQSGGRDKLRISIVETTTDTEVPLCHECTHRVKELQHEDAAFALKAELDPHVEVIEETIEDIDVNGDGLEDYSDVENSFKKENENTNFRSASSRQSRSRKRSPKAPKRKSVVTNNAVEDLGVAPPKVVFPESEYDVLEKRLISLESEIQQAADNEQFKRLCKMGVMCEERWARLYCKDYGKPWEEFRSEAISVLKHNLDIRREGIRPFMKMQNKLSPNDPMSRTIKRDIHMANPSVNIAMGRMGNSHEMFRGMTKRVFATCIPITTLTTAPQQNYSFNDNDQCFIIENDLFDVEHRLKRCAPNTKEYDELIEHGRRLREEWRHANEDMKRGKSVEDDVPAGYDIRKCVVVGRNRRQARENGEIVPGTADESDFIDITH